ncbi:MAG: NUDIX hydrolase [Thermoplasmata archaeon]|nr:NUDIX domain-containing protein [Thermoplasmata archaeon]
MLDWEKVSGKLLDYTNVKGKYGKDAAVCAVIDDNYNIILEKRVQNEKDPWSGQVSFPGGHFEKNDIYIINTALRELKEETGINNIKILGGLEIQHPKNMPSLNVYPFLCYKEKFDKLIPQKDEIQYFFIPNIMELKEGVTNINMDGKTSPEKCFIYKNEIIWGMTARIIEKIKDLFKDH